MGFDDGTMTDAKGVRTITPFLDRRNFDAEVNFFTASYYGRKDDTVRRLRRRSHFRSLI